MPSVRRPARLPFCRISERHIVVLQQMRIPRVINAESEKIVIRPYCRMNRRTSRKDMRHVFLAISSSPKRS